METIEAWVTRQLREVAEDGKSVRSIRITSGEEGRQWERFDAPLREEEGGPGPAKLAEMIEELIKGFSEEWPAKRTVQVHITAYDAEGLEKSTYPKSVRGRSATAKDSVLGGEALGIAQASLVHTEATKALLTLQMTQNKAIANQLATSYETNNFLIEKLVEEKIDRALQDQSNAPDVAEKLAESLAEQLGPLSEMILGAITKGNA